MANTASGTLTVVFKAECADVKRFAQVMNQIGDAGQGIIDTLRAEQKILRMQGRHKDVRMFQLAIDKWESATHDLLEFLDSDWLRIHELECVKRDE